MYILCSTINNIELHTCIYYVHTYEYLMMSSNPPLMLFFFLPFFPSLRMAGSFPSFPRYGLRGLEAQRPY